MSNVRARLVSVSPWSVAVWVGVAVYVVLLSVESVREHGRFETQWDLAIYDQLVWLLANGHEPFSTVITRPMLEGHFQPALVLLTPVYWLGLGLPGLLTAQSIGLALTAPALFALSRASGASPALAAIPAFLWLACPLVATVNLFDFRPDPFAPALLVVGVLAALRRRHLLLGVTTVVALSLKEDIALTYVMLGLILAFRGERRVGGILAVGSAAWFLVATQAMNALGTSNEAFSRRFAGDRGDSVGEALVWMLQHPLDTLGDVASHSAGDLVLLFVLTGCLGLLAPSWMLLSLPTVLHNALSAYGNQHDLVHHYHLGTLTGFFVAAAIGTGRIPALGRPRRLVVLALVAGGAIMSLGGSLWVHETLTRAGPPKAAEIRLALERIPDDAAVSASQTLLAHLSQRVDVYSLPEPFLPVGWGTSLTPDELARRAERVRFVAYRERDEVPSGGFAPAQDIGTITRELRRLGFAEVERVGAVHILERPQAARLR